MAGELRDYLPLKTADYSGVLNISPKHVMEEVGEYPQKRLETDGRVIHVITIDEIPDITVTIEFDWLSEGDVIDVLDMYFNKLKAKGMARSFYWDHPKDGNRYVVRFMEPIRRKTAYHRGFLPIVLKVEGYYV